ncbi:MAG: carbohydrate ABC transporter permease [Spirochaetales bacterium]|nr:carbohydrate ABC transporter permease [Spirochaetales bacterium]
MRGTTKHSPGGEVLWLVSVGLILIVVFLPIYWMIVGSLRPNTELFRFPPSLWPQDFTFEVYGSILADFGFVRSLANTVLVAGLTTASALAIATSGAYGMSRYRFRGRKALQYYILATQMLPVVLLTLPFFVAYSGLGLYNTRLGLVIAYVSFTVPFCALTMLGFINGIPRSMDEAAWIDGAGPFRTFVVVIVPLSKAGIVGTGVFAFVNAWNEYLMAVVLTSSDRARMLVVWIGNKIGQYDILWNELLAATVVASIPLIVLYGMVQKSFVRGVTAGAVKM